MRLFSFVTAIAIALGVQAQNFPNPGRVTGNTAVHDPTICRDSAGTYFVFSTAPGIEIRTSTDRINWTLRGRVWPNGASWTDQYTLTSNGNLWAPECYYSNGVFNLYYSASSFGSQNSAIFFARSNTGLPGSFTNLGLITSTTSSNNYNAIDPNVFVENGSWYLSLGSWWTGIKGTTADPSTGKLTGTLSALATRGGGIEASTIYKSGSYYYLFTSVGNCCAGTSSTYNIRVGRSTSRTGPYVDQAGVALTAGGGTLILGTHGSIYGPGGQDIMDDVDGTVLIYHYYTSSGSYLGINLLNFSTGWPVVV